MTKKTIMVYGFNDLDNICVCSTKIGDPQWEKKTVRGKKKKKSIPERPTDCKFKYLPSMNHHVLLFH